MNSEKWDEFLKEKQKALIFDTESTYKKCLREE